MHWIVSRKHKNIFTWLYRYTHMVLKRNISGQIVLYRCWYTCIASPDHEQATPAEWIGRNALLESALPKGRICSCVCHYISNKMQPVLSPADGTPINCVVTAYLSLAVSQCSINKAPGHCVIGGVDGEQQTSRFLLAFLRRFITHWRRFRAH